MKYTAKRFSDDAQVSPKLAKRVIDALDEKQLSAEDMNVVLWKLRDMVMKANMQTLLDKVKDNEIHALIDQIIVERAMWKNRCGPEVCYAETPEALSRAFSGTLVPEVVWFFEEIATKAEGTVYKTGDVVTIQIFRVGKWEHPDYGTVEITKKTIKDVVENFEENRRGIRLCVDENHEPDHKALGWYQEVFSDDAGKAAFAKIELTKKGADLLNEGAYRYFSPEICFHKTDEETGDTISNLLVGGAFTNRPFFKGMQPLMATEGAATGGKNGKRSATQSAAYFFSPQATMHKFLMALDALAEKATISASEAGALEALFNELPEADRSAEVTKAYDEVRAKFNEEGGEAAKTPEEVAAEAAAAAGTVVEKTPEELEAERVAAEGGEAPAADVALAATEGTVKKNDDGSFTVDEVFMEKAKKAQSALAATVRDATLNACEASTKALLFSEKTPTNVVLPKHVEKIKKFSSSLNEKARKEFFEIIGGLKAVPAGELGHGHNAAKKTGEFAEAKDVPVDDEKVKFFMERMGQSLEDAQKSAFNDYKAEKTKKN